MLGFLERPLASRHVISGTQGAVTASGINGRRVMKHAEIVEVQMALTDD